jgi:hypothetical protein
MSIDAPGSLMGLKITPGTGLLAWALVAKAMPNPALTSANMDGLLAA